MEMRDLNGKSEVARVFIPLELHLPAALASLDVCDSLCTCPWAG